MKLAAFSECLDSVPFSGPEAQQRHNETMQRVNHKHEKFNTQVQQIKFDGGQQQTGISSMATKLQDVEVSLKTSEQELRDVNERERRQTQDTVRSMREAVVSEYGRKLELLENKFAARMESEAESRQETLAQIVESVNVCLMREGLQPLRQVVRATGPVRVATQQSLPCGSQALKVSSGSALVRPQQVPVAMSLPAGALQRGPSGSAFVSPPTPGHSPMASISMQPPMLVPMGSGVQMPAPVMSAGASLSMAPPTTSMMSSIASVPRLMSVGAA